MGSYACCSAAVLPRAIFSKSIPGLFKSGFVNVIRSVDGFSCNDFAVMASILMAFRLKSGRVVVSIGALWVGKEARPPALPRPLAASSANCGVLEQRPKHESRGRGVLETRWTKRRKEERCILVLDRSWM